MFTTRTGQTGRDAYVYEAGQIANAQRALDERMGRLLRVVHDEAPELFDCRSDWSPEFNGSASGAQKFGEYLSDAGRAKRAKYWATFPSSQRPPQYRD